MLNHKEEIISDAFGLWISALFSDICGYNPELSFSEQKKYFFSLLKELLDSGKIKFSTPNEFWVDGNNIWEVENSVVINYLMEKWPKQAQSEMELIDYFYEIPAVIWVAEDGTLHAS